MTLADPQISYTILPLYHRHEWHIHVRAESWFSFADTTPEEIDDDVYARCEDPDCGAVMTKEQIEAILNNVFVTGRLLTDE